MPSTHGLPPCPSEAPVSGVISAGVQPGNGLLHGRARRHRFVPFRKARPSVSPCIVGETEIHIAQRRGQCDSSKAGIGAGETGGLTLQQIECPNHLCLLPRVPARPAIGLRPAQPLDQPGDTCLGDAMTEGGQATFRHPAPRIDRQQAVAAEGAVQILGDRQAVDQGSDRHPVEVPGTFSRGFTR